jgi:hypothetical protein
MSVIRTAFYIATTALAFGFGTNAMGQSPSTGGSHMEAVHEVQMSATPVRADPNRAWANDLDYLKDVDKAYFRSAQRILDVYINADVGVALSESLLAKDIQAGIRTRQTPDEEYKLNPTNMTTYILPDLMGGRSVPNAANNLRVVTLSGNAQKKLLIEMKRLNDALYRVENRYKNKYEDAAKEAAEASKTAEIATPAATAAPVDSMAIYNAIAARQATEEPVIISVPVAKTVADTAEVAVSAVAEVAAAEDTTVEAEEPTAAPVSYNAETAKALRATYEQGVITAVRTGKEPKQLSAASMEIYGDSIVHLEPSKAFITKVRAAYEAHQLRAIQTGKDLSPVSIQYAEQFGVSENTAAFQVKVETACAKATTRSAQTGKPVSAIVLSYQNR